MYKDYNAGVMHEHMFACVYERYRTCPRVRRRAAVGVEDDSCLKHRIYDGVANALCLVSALSACIRSQCVHDTCTGSVSVSSKLKNTSVYVFFHYLYSF